MRPLVHPGLMASLGNFYPFTCQILSENTTRNDLAERIKTFAPVTGLESIPCQILDPKGEQVARGGQEVAVVLIGPLQGYFPQITPDMQAIVQGKAWGILTIVSDFGVQTTLKLAAAS
jgi:hypothetical protein